MSWFKNLFSRGPETQEREAEAPVSASPRRQSYSLGEVFTPGQPADKGFVSRPQQEADLQNILVERGTQILVWGESGAGKSSLVRNVLKNVGQASITTRCEATTTYEQVLSSAFDRMNAMAESGRSNQDNQTVSASTDIGGPVSPVTLQAGVSTEVGSTTDYARVVPAQLTSEALAVRLGAKGLVWVIEDFHKVSPETRTRLADAMKVFSDESANFPQLRMIVLGVAETAGEILRAPSNMGGRLADIPIPPLDDDELGLLLDKGNDLLNVDFGAVRNRIIKHSVGVASITHALARECCTAVGVLETSRKRMYVTVDALEIAKSAYSRTRGGNMKEDFDVALEVTQTRKYHNYAIILRAVAALPERGATHAQILAKIREDLPDYPAGNLTTYLRKLQSEERKALIRKTSEGLFRYNRPLQHAYAILRFKLPISAEEEFWATDLSVSAEEQDVSVRLATEENPDAPNAPE
ncbi:ATP-binding protein [Microbacterium sp. NPDC077486]|uniref:ATP-binding protein n=1 Tax=Microbacterium sp. NPDC077486 TaxID=3154766 RepID=UPI003413C074